MLPNEILPAIPRQKVKCATTGIVGNVIRVGLDGKFVAVMRKNLIGDGEFFEEWLVKDCEIVPEEPRPFRVGQKVVVVDAVDEELKFTTVTAVFEGGDDPEGVEVTNGNIYFPNNGKRDGYVRHATPSEVAQYFN